MNPQNYNLKYLTGEQGWFSESFNRHICDKYCTYVKTDNGAEWACDDNELLTNYKLADIKTDEHKYKCNIENKPILNEGFIYDKKYIESPQDDIASNYIKYNGSNTLENSDKKLYNRSQKDCMKLCNLDNECVSIEYNLNNKECNLNSQQLFPNNDDIKSEYYVKKNKIINPDGNIHMYFNDTCLNSSIASENNNLNNKLSLNNSDKLKCNSNNSNIFYSNSNTKNIKVNNQCLEENNSDIILNNCDDNNLNQKFIFDKYTNQLRTDTNVNNCINITMKNNDASFKVNDCSNNYNNRFKLHKLPYNYINKDTFNNVSDIESESDSYSYINLYLIIIIILLFIMIIKYNK